MSHFSPSPHEKAVGRHGAVFFISLCSSSLSWPCSHEKMEELHFTPKCHRPLIYTVLTFTQQMEQWRFVCIALGVFLHSFVQLNFWNATQRDSVASLCLACVEPFRLYPQSLVRFQPGAKVSISAFPLILLVAITLGEQGM